MKCSCFSMFAFKVRRSGDEENETLRDLTNEPNTSRAEHQSIYVLLVFPKHENLEKYKNS